jgi:HSP20 family molecular chaperone IbpA
MSNKNSKNLISLMSVFDDICDVCINNTPSSISSDCSSNYSTSTDDTLMIGKYNYYPQDFSYLWGLPYYTFDYKVDTPSYPVSNFSVLEDGTSIIEIAVSGFKSSEISVKREDLKIVVVGKKEGREKNDSRKYIYKNIGERDFTLDFQGSSKWDYDKLEATIKNGILSIHIPMKEECKPINTIYPIK